MDLDRFLTGPQAQLAEILRNRDLRAEKQRQLLDAFPGPLVSFSLNVAGPVKRFPLADRAFETGRDEVGRLLAGKNWPILFFEETRSDCGLECIWSVEAPALDVKAETTVLEETHPLGRLFDLDVIGRGGGKLQRTEVGFPQRGCIVCGKAGMGCARSRAHDVADLQRATVTLLKDYFDRAFAEGLSRLAVQALLYEVSVTPKPGLVDRVGNGAHPDMDFFTFLDSSCALGPYFREISQTTLGLAHVEPEGLLLFLAHAGRKAEGVMYRATGGVNTHKGAIYSVGILCAAYSYAYANGIPACPEEIFNLCARIAAPRMEELDGSLRRTAGEQIYCRHGITGARGEAAGGFPAVRDTGLPVYRKSLGEGFSPNDAGVIALLHIIAQMDDTNAIKRVGLEGAAQARAAVRQAVETLPGRELLRVASQLDADFTAGNISFGGAADMLALTVAVCLMDEWMVSLPGGDDSPTPQPGP